MASDDRENHELLEKKPTFSISGDNLDMLGLKNDKSTIKDENTKTNKSSRFKVEFVDEKKDPTIPEAKDPEAGECLPNGDAQPQNLGDNSDENKSCDTNPIDKVSTKHYPTNYCVPRKASRLESISSSIGVGENYEDSVPVSPNASYYDTKNWPGKTFAKDTLDTAPHMDHYRNLLSATGAMRKRPTLLELHDPDMEEGKEFDHNGQVLHSEHVGHGTEEAVNSQPSGYKFGWMKGVFVRCLLNIWGVMLFMRLSWVVGQAGIGFASIVILLSAVVTTITALSMSAICTNGEVKGGGAYFMISRSLGPEYGGAIGLIFSCANAVAVAMYVVGFAETIRDLLKAHDCLMVDEINDVRIIGIVTIIILLCIAMVGMEWEAMAQVGLLVILLIAIADFMIGSFLQPSISERAKGFVGYNRKVFIDNWGPDFHDGEGFFSVFAVFFPAATGILAGANISGDLEDAQKAIPKGTLLAILITTITYLIMAWMAGSCMVRNATDFMFTVATNSTIVMTNQTQYNDEPFLMESHYSEPKASDCYGTNCTYGLQNDMAAMQVISAFGPIIIAGIIAATLSSALASLISAPKVFQAVCKDKIFPYIHVFAKSYGKRDEPRRAYALAFAIGIGCICIGKLNDIAPLISNFFLMSYALINYSCFDASLAKSPGWRPAFRFYWMWLSLVGAIICLVIMFVISWQMALVTFGLVTTLYLYVHYSKPEINWGSSTQAHVYRNALTFTQKLVTVEEHVKNYRPQVLVLSGFPGERPSLVDFSANLTKGQSLLTCGHVHLISDDRLYDTRCIIRDGYNWLQKRKVKAFYTPVMAYNFRQGIQALLQCCGTGKLRPNLLMMGFKSNWQECDPKYVEEYFSVMHDAFDLSFGVGLLRTEEGFHTVPADTSHLSEEIGNTSKESSVSKNSSDNDLENIARQVEPEDVIPEVPSGEALSDQERENLIMTPSSTDLLDLGHSTTYVTKSSSLAVPKVKLFRPVSNPDPTTDLPLLGVTVKDTMNHERFHHRQKKGNIDVWWLFDDGGLTLLLPYILTTKSHWRDCKLRVFSAETKKGQLDRDQRHMATLLSRFRISYQDMKIVPNIGKRPKDASIQEFYERIKPVKLGKGETEESHPWKITEAELSTQKSKTYRHIRLRELLKEHSADSKLIVMSLPMPRKGLVKSMLYMSWIDTLTKDMPPILLIRGNQQSVLTYYS